MPDAQGNFKGMSVPADAWERIFGKSAPRSPATTDKDSHEHTGKRKDRA